MITLAFWKKVEVESYISYLGVILVSILTIVADIVLLPFEILAFLLHWLLEGDWREWNE